nr:vegetative cell wall protein gp1-like [Setaria viridis]
MAVATAAAPPLLPTLTARSLPAALLPTPPPTGRLIPSPDLSAPPIHRLSPSPAYIPLCRRLAACSPDSPMPAASHLAPSPALATPSTRTSPAPPIHSRSAAYVPPCRRLTACSPDSTAPSAPHLAPSPTPTMASARTSPAVIPTLPLSPRLIASPASPVPPIHSRSAAYVPPCRRLAFAHCDPHPIANPRLIASPASPAPPIHSRSAAYVPPCRRLAVSSLDSTAPSAPRLAPTPALATASARSSPAVIPTPPRPSRLIASPASPVPPIHHLPPSLVYVPPSRHLAACSLDSPAPSAPRLATSPTPAAPSASNPGRASARKSWFRDKAARANLALPSSPERIKGFKVPGRASLSWVKDRVASFDVLANRGCCKRNLTSPADNIGKKMRYESPPSSEDSGSDSELKFYAGPAFHNAPPASSLPIPISFD